MQSSQEKPEPERKPFLGSSVFARSGFPHGFPGMGSKLRSRAPTPEHSAAPPPHRDESLGAEPGCGAPEQRPAGAGRGGEGRGGGRAGQRVEQGLRGGPGRGRDRRRAGRGMVERGEGRAEEGQAGAGAELLAAGHCPHQAGARGRSGGRGGTASDACRTVSRKVTGKWGRQESRGRLGALLPCSGTCCLQEISISSLHAE